MSWKVRSACLFGLAMAPAIGAAAPAWAHGITERVSLGPGGVQGDSYSSEPAVSADGRFVAFYSSASNLVPGDTNDYGDVFARDRKTGKTERVSLGPGDAQGNSDSFRPAISADGRFVAFSSLASNLVPGDTNQAEDVFVRDHQNGTTRLVSLGRGGIQGNGYSEFPSITADGRFVAFDSQATNLVPGDTNGRNDVFVRDRQNGTTRRVSLGLGGVQGNDYSLHPAISADGRFVAFESFATNLVPSDTNGVEDVFIRDRKTGTTARMSLGRGGVQGNGGSYSVAISADGRFVSFVSEASNLVPGDTNGKTDVFVRDRQNDTTRRVSLGPGGVQGNGDSSLVGIQYPGAISADGRFVSFDSDASNLVPDDTNRSADVFIRDRKTGTTRRVSLGPGGVQGNAGSLTPAISADGWFVAFYSDASNLVPGDTNRTADVFVRILVP